jgi:hypothetical protein
MTSVEEAETPGAREYSEVAGHGSLTAIDPNSREEETFRQRCNRKFGRIPRTMGACCMMLILGITLILVASLVSDMKTSTRISLYVIGSLLLIPSLYVGYILYHVFRDTPGFDLDGLPLWDELIG